MSRRESDSLVRLRTESELSGEISSESKSPHLIIRGEEGGEEGGGSESLEREETLKEEGEDLWLVWSEILKNWDENYKRNLKNIRQLARAGIPGALRGIAWQLMCGAQDHNLRDRYPALLTVRTTCQLVLYMYIYNMYVGCSYVCHVCYFHDAWCALIGRVSI